jgi:hypothetical protein
MIRNVTILFSIFIFVAIAIPANAQLLAVDHVVINEVDINPPGDDSASPNEWVELYNPTDSDVDISGWKIASTTVLKQTLTVPFGTVIKADQFLKYSYKTVWFTDANEVVELRDDNGIIVDATPILTDIKNDFTSWQRIYDGHDLDSVDDWKFEKSNAGSSNGKISIADDTQDISVTINSSKPSYLYGETVFLQGFVSEKVSKAQAGSFSTESINIIIKGPGYSHNVLLYPDLYLNFGTTLSLQSVLGINEGVYNVSVTYAGATSSTSFTVGNEIIDLEISEEITFAMVTDKPQYLPGETVYLTGITSKVIPFEGLRYNVKNPNGLIIAAGTLYPTNNEFSGTIFLTTIDPVYGTYVISGEYFDTSISAISGEFLDKISTSFDLVADEKEDVIISLWTDKEVYGLGDVVTITGRLNDLWVSSLDLEIVQTRNIALGVRDFTGGGFDFKILNVVRLEGDSSFKYSFQIPNKDTRLGDYKIQVSKAVGTAIKTIVVVEDPANYVSIREPLSLSTDKSVYGFGDKIIISGFVENLWQSTTYTPIVNVTIRDKFGGPLEIIGGTGGGKLSTTGSEVGYFFTAIPDASGRYKVSTELYRSIFDEGQYLVTAKYLKNSNSVTFSVTDLLATPDGPIVSLDKEVYGFGETVHLSGLIPPTGDPSVKISLTKPDGSVINSGATIDNQQFSWEWVTPSTEKQQTVKFADRRSLFTTNEGTYKIRVSTDTHSRTLFFKLSSDPANDSLVVLPVNVFTEKPIYKAGEKLKVLGSVILRVQGEEGLVVPERVHLTITSELKPTVKIFQASVYPDQGGNFMSLFELPITIFSEGQYKVKAEYLRKITTYSFGVANDFTFGGDEPLSLLISSDKSQYHPGDVVFVTGKPSKLIYITEYVVSVLKKTGSELTCGSFICGTHSGQVATIRPSPNGSFSYQLSIPDSLSSIGKYEVIVDGDFDTKTLIFDVVDPSAVGKLSQIFIEKVNSIPDSSVSVSVVQKDIDGIPVGPRVLLGSLIVSPRGEEPNVNLRVVSDTGICIIGQERDCLVKESTRKPGEIYDIVVLPAAPSGFFDKGEKSPSPLEGFSLKVRYSGPDARVEKFSILPESATEMLPDHIWDIQVVKSDQVSRLYYKINYSPLTASFATDLERDDEKEAIEFDH